MNKNFNKWLLAAAGAALLASSLSASAADLLETIKSRGTIKVALEGNYPPFNFKDPKSGELTGFEVDVAKLLAAKLGVKPEFTTTEWSGILAGLGAGKYDVILNQVGITEERQKAFDFSDPYTLSSAQLIVRKDETRQFNSLEDLKGKKLGLGQGTNFEQKAKSVAGVDVRTYPGSPEYLADLAAGRIDAALNDSLLVSYILKSTKLPLKGGSPVGAIDKIGIPLHKGNPKFLAALNKALADIKADGSFRQASEKWFGIDVSQPPKAQ